MKSFKLNIGLSRRIYISMLAIIVISSLTIAVFTVYFFKNQNEKYHLARLERKEKRVANSIKYFVQKSHIAPNLTEVPKDFYEKMDELTKENEMELKVYTTDGQILLSLEEEISISDSISSTILEKVYSNPKLFHIERKNKQLLSISTLKYCTLVLLLFISMYQKTNVRAIKIILNFSSNYLFFYFD